MFVCVIKKDKCKACNSSGVASGSELRCLQRLEVYSRGDDLDLVRILPPAPRPLSATDTSSETPRTDMFLQGYVQENEPRLRQYMGQD